MSRATRVARVARVATFCLCLSAIAGRAAAQAPPTAASSTSAPELTRARVAELSKAAPAARVATAEAGVATAAVTGAGVLAIDNPVLSVQGGLRANPSTGSSPSVTTSISWPVELGGQRGARVGAAEAAQRAAVATTEDTQRKTLLAALLRHAQVLRDERQLGLAADRRALATRLVLAAEKRQKAGEVGEVDVALVTLQLARETAAETAARGAVDADKRGLLTLLGLTAADATVTGTLVPSGEPPALPALLRDTSQRTDVRAATAAVEAAALRAESARAARWPSISVIGQYQTEEGAHIATLGVAVPLPILNANRTEVAVSAAEVHAAEARAKATQSGATGSLQELHTRFSATKKALDALAPTGELAARAVALATRAYELGEGDLASVLVVRREAVEAQAALLEAEHAHANAKIELMVAAGKVPQ